MDEIPLEDEGGLAPTVPSPKKPALSGSSPQKLTGDAQIQNPIALLEKVEPQHLPLSHISAHPKLPFTWLPISHSIDLLGLADTGDMKGLPNRQ